MLRGGLLLLDRNSKGYEVAEHIAKKVEVNPRTLSSVVGTLGILAALVKIKIGQGSSNSGIFSGRPSKIPFVGIHFSLVKET